MRPRDLFRRLSLDVKLISSYLVILGIGGLAISVVGSWIVSTTIWREAQRTVAHDLAIARTVYDQRLELVRRTVEASAAGITIPRYLEAGDRAALAAYLGEVRRQGGLDFLGLTDASGGVLLRPGGEPASGAGTELASLAPVRSALAGRAAAATAVVPAQVLAREDPALARRARMRRVATPH
ncbi:MAG TPA: hypothetical protein VJG13_04380, partial [Thermoanaerobaculia bacterium]|nr:hypothetical protein [Thermoanaerobaculia bacterium]